MCPLVPRMGHSKQFFFVDYDVELTRLEKPGKGKHSWLLGPFISYEYNNVLWMCPLVPRMGDSDQFFFCFVDYDVEMKKSSQAHDAKVTQGPML